MIVYVDTDGSGNVTGVYARQQSVNQTSMDDQSAAVQTYNSKSSAPKSLDARVAALEANVAKLQAATASVGS